MSEIQSIRVYQEHELYSLSRDNAADLLIALGADQADAEYAADTADQEGIYREPVGIWHVQLDHVADGRFIASVHAKRTAAPETERERT